MPNWWDDDETVEASGRPVGNWWDDDETVPANTMAKKRAPKRWWDKDTTVRQVEPTAPLSVTGDAHDGDTFRLNTGQNGRLYGVDAFELDQQGRKGGQPVPLGRQARDAIIPYLHPDTAVTPTGPSTYGRPVVSLSADGRDAGRGLLDQGMGLATPRYLKDDDRLGEYMEAERLARLNRRGAHAGEFQNPADFRAGKLDPWADPEWIDGPQAGSRAVFFDDPTPFQGLRPEIAEGYQKIWLDMSSSPDDLLAYAKANGFIIDPAETRKAYAERAKRGAGPTIRYVDPPKLLTNSGDGAVGAGVRGLSDPINMLDEMGAVVDALGGTDGRENIWSSDRRFGDILDNNLGQNRSILAYDDANHPYARFGGQLASGLVLPGASAEGVGLAAARAVLREGGSRFAAEEAAKAAVRSRLGVAGAAEGGLAGFGAGEGGPIDRLPSAGIGAVTGGALGYGTGVLAQELGPWARQLVDRIRGRGAVEAVTEQAPGIGTDEILDAMQQPPVRFAGMANEADAAASISSPRLVDRINVNDRVRPMLDPASDLERMRQAERVNPSDVLPVPSNAVTSMDEAASIGAGMRPEVEPQNEMDELARRNLPSPRDGTRTLPKRGPLDLITFLRTHGGLKDDRGDLAAIGLRNSGRDMDFARGEQRFGKIVDQDKGLQLDIAADLAWRAGYFPDHGEPPHVSDFITALDTTNRAILRHFRPDDMEEVTAFNAARDQRYAVEKAREDGAPLVTDRGEPVTLDDLEANAPPVSAYEEWGEQAPDFAGNIRLANLDGPEAIKRALVTTEQRTGGFDAARRGRISQAETQSLANELGMTPQQLLARRKGQAFNAEEALAARQILAKSGSDLVKMARAVQRLDDPGEEKLASFRQAWVRHVAIQEQVAGATAEAGRVLAQFRMVADGRNVRGNVLNALAEGGGGKERLKRAADMILDHVEDPGQMNQEAAKLLRPKMLDKINEYWINSLLSGPQTHVVNMLSNTMTALAQIPEHGAAALVGAARRAVVPSANADRVMFSELGARSVGLLQGAKEGLRQAARTFKTGDSSDFAGKVEARAQDAISGTKGKIIRTPTRLLSAEDELFKGMARRMELSGLAVRQAGKEGLAGDEARQRAAELLANPTDDMLDRAFDYGRYVTFQRPLGPAAQGISTFTQNMPGAKFILPFIRTPTNLLKFSLERSPAAPLVDHWRADFRAGGARRDLAVARALVGTGVGAAVAELAANGYLTGNGPADPGAKALLRADGWQPYSVKIGDKYISYQRLDPFASTLGVAAGMVELQEHMTEKQQDRVALLVTTSVLQNLSSKTWLSGMGDLVEAVNDPQRYGSAFARRLAGSAAVPAGAAQVARTIDPTLREAEDIFEAIKARIPSASKTLAERRDVWGNPVVGEGGVGPDIFSPVWASTAKNDPINKALLKAGVSISQPLRDVKTASGAMRRLSGKEYGDYRQVAGSLAYTDVAELVASPDWMAMDQTERKKEVTRILRGARERARGALGF